MILKTKKNTKRLKASVYAFLFAASAFAQNANPIPQSYENAAIPDSAKNAQLEEVIAVGTRTAPRTATSTPLPIDNLSAADLKSSGQISFDKALQYKVPSFNSVSLPVQDATSLLDPYEIRNLGPSRTLILINGKRKNMSALAYIQNTPGKGEVGADLAAIPMSAIKSIEILRDGASAQYGSDAIAGVMNIILKDKIDYSEASIFSGIRAAGDGLTYGANLNTGATFANKGFVNFTASFKDQRISDTKQNIDPWADADPNIGFGADLNYVKNWLAKNPSGKNIAGSPAITSANLVINTSIPVNNNASVYGNAAFVTKRVLSFANGRTPYWKSTDYGLLTAPGQTYDGFRPTFEGEMKDYNATVGLKNKVNGWNIDMSGTAGGNEQLYYVNNTLNFSLAAKSPIAFRPGGFKFNHLVGNIDITKAVADNLSLAFGSEFRSEQFEIVAGDTASYSGGGANSFPGFRQENAGKFGRFNIGFYADMSWDITKNFLVNLTGRYERYSDFGDAFVGKFSTRLNIVPKILTLRASASTGFKAPSLHQLNLQLAQATFVAGNIAIEGILNNSNPSVKQLGVPALKPEESINFTGGLGFTPNKNLSITLDYYNITINNRVVLSSRLKKSGFDAASDLYKLMDGAGVSAVSFFINGINTRSQGIDFVVNYKNLALGSGSKLNFNLAGNWNQNVRIGGIATPDAISKAGGVIFNRTEESIILTARPQYKAILSVDYVQKDKLSISLNNTLFGTSKFVNADLPNSGKSAEDKDADKYAYLEFLPQILTDLVVSYDFSKSFSASFAANNILNITPKYTLKNLSTENQVMSGKTVSNDEYYRNILSFNGRYAMTSYDASHFSILGTTFMLTLNFKF